MTSTTTPEPIRKSLRVGVAPRRAFEVFTAGMHRWWPVENTLLASPRTAIVVEPHEGGRWFERGADGTECDWGRVLAWEPPTRILLAWQIDARWRFDPGFVTELEVRFVPDGTDGTRVELTHRNLERFGEQAGALRAALDSGWGKGLEAFAAAASAGA
ncbi:MAG TPA: SRPBCC family protein [Thermodesulfobacteriota bacterium]